MFFVGVFGDVSSLEVLGLQERGGRVQELVREVQYDEHSGLWKK